jgi:mRNA-degrading endonuclease RelE of RelBE toxin-antitoxin system
MRLESLAPMDLQSVGEKLQEYCQQIANPPEQGKKRLKCKIASGLQIRRSDYEKVKNVGKSDGF